MSQEIRDKKQETRSKKQESRGENHDNIQLRPILNFVRIQIVSNGKHPKRTERKVNVQWTFIANGPACAMASGCDRGLQSRIQEN